MTIVLLKIKAVISVYVGSGVIKLERQSSDLNAHRQRAKKKWWITLVEGVKKSLGRGLKKKE